MSVLLCLVSMRTYEVLIYPPLPPLLPLHESFIQCYLFLLHLWSFYFTCIDFLPSIEILLNKIEKNFLCSILTLSIWIKIVTASYHTQRRNKITKRFWAFSTLCILKNQLELLMKLEKLGWLRHRKWAKPKNMACLKNSW